MAKKGKFSSDDQRALKTTFVVLVVVALAASIFLFFNKDKEKRVRKKALVSEAVTEPVQKKVVVSTRTTPVLPIKAKKKMIEQIPSASGAKIAFILDDWGYRL